MLRRLFSRSALDRLELRSASEARGATALCIRAVLWLAVLLFGAHAGASLYEMLVVTPQWVLHSSQFLRDSGGATSAVLRPMAYKEPAVIVLGTVSMAMLWLSMWRSAARGWMAVAGGLGVMLVTATVLVAFPILERSMRDVGAGLADGDIALDAQAWELWCTLRLLLLLAAWAASLTALVRASSRQFGQWFTPSVRF